jgi:hypothetical protein
MKILELEGLIINDEGEKLVSTIIEDDFGYLWAKESDDTTYLNLLKIIKYGTVYILESVLYPNIQHLLS